MLCPMAFRLLVVLAARVVQTVGQVGAEVVVADGLAGRQRAVSEHQERLALPDPLDLSRERLEERRRAAKNG